MVDDNGDEGDGAQHVDEGHQVLVHVGHRGEGGTVRRSFTEDGEVRTEQSTDRGLPPLLGSDMRYDA